MALYIPHSIFHLARLLYVRPETFETYYVVCYISDARQTNRWVDSKVLIEQNYAFPEFILILSVS